MKIEVFGAGCKKCHKTYELIESILKEKNIEAELVAIDDIAKIVENGIFLTPSVFIDGKKMTEGKIPDKSTVEKWLTI